jgi:hypothetical protein
MSEPIRCPICHVIFPAQCRNERGEKLLNLTGRHDLTTVNKETPDA